MEVIPVFETTFPFFDFYIVSLYYSFYSTYKRYYLELTPPDPPNQHVAIRNIIMCELQRFHSLLYHNFYHFPHTPIIVRIF